MMMVMVMSMLMIMVMMHVMMCNNPGRMMQPPKLNSESIAGLPVCRD